MSWIKQIFSRRRIYGELSEEIRGHLQEKVEELSAGGMSRKEAVAAARREFGNVGLTEEDGREVWRRALIEDLLVDVRYGLRGLRKNPGFAAVAVLTLALGIGANTAIFSVVNAVLLRPLPFQNASRLVRAFGKSPITDESDVSPADFVDYRKQNHVFDRLEGLIDGATIFNLAGADKPTLVKGTVVTSGFFDVLGIQPLLGRTFAAADEGVSNPQVVVLSHRLWRERFGGDAGAIGKSVVLDGSRMTVVGVLREDVPLFPDGELWIPAPFEVTGMRSREARFLVVIGALKAGTTISQAQAELDTIAGRLEKQYPDSNAGWSTRLVPLQTTLVGGVRPALLVLLGAVALVLLIACANVASLLLARNSSRTREIAIRVTLGAGRLRLVRQMLTESVLLAMAGGGAGIVLARWGVEFLKRLAPESLPRLNEVSVSGTVLAFTGCVAVFTGILFGLGPALQASRRDTTQNLKEGSAAGQSKSKHRAHDVLVIAEVALSLVVLIASGLLLNSFWRLTRVNPGFDPSNIVTTRISVTSPSIEKDVQRRAFFDKLQERIASMPGVESAGFVSELPLSGQQDDTYVTIAEHPPVRPEDRLDADFREVAGDYFRAMRIPLLKGREFTNRDTADSSFAVLINEPFAKRFFGGENPIGKHLQIYEGDYKGREGFVTREIVGVVGGIKHVALQEALRPEMFLPYAQSPSLRMNIVVRSAGNPVTVASAIRSAVSSIDPDEATSAFRTLGEIVSTSTAGDRFNTFLLAAFGGMALLLTAAGIGAEDIVGGFVSHQAVNGWVCVVGIDWHRHLHSKIGRQVEISGYVVATELKEVGDCRWQREILDYGATEADVLVWAEAAFCLAVEQIEAKFFDRQQGVDVHAAVDLRRGLIGCGSEERLWAEGNHCGCALPTERDQVCFDIATGDCGRLPARIFYADASFGRRGGRADFRRWKQNGIRALSAQFVRHWRVAAA